MQEAQISILFWDNKMANFGEKNEDISSVKPRDRSDGLDSFERP